MITGSNVGLGFEAAVHLARLNPAKLVIACRSIAKGEEAKTHLLARIPDFKGEVEVWELDLGGSTDLATSFIP